MTFPKIVDVYRDGSSILPMLTAAHEGAATQDDLEGAILGVVPATEQKRRIVAPIGTLEDTPLYIALGAPFLPPHIDSRSNYFRPTPEELVTTYNTSSRILLLDAYVENGVRIYSVRPGIVCPRDIFKVSLRGDKLSAVIRFIGNDAARAIRSRLSSLRPVPQETLPLLRIATKRVEKQVNRNH